MKFKITPEDIGKVAIGSQGREYTLLAATKTVGCFEYGGSLFHFFPDGRPKRGDLTEALTHWKPETLRMPFRWWVIYKDKIKLSWSISRPYLTVSQLNYVAALIYARVPPDHVPIGTFHTEEDAERIRMEETGS